MNFNPKVAFQWNTVIDLSASALTCCLQQSKDRTKILPTIMVPCLCWDFQSFNCSSCDGCSMWFDRPLDTNVQEYLSAEGIVTSALRLWTPYLQSWSLPMEFPPFVVRWFNEFGVLLMRWFPCYGFWGFMIDRTPSVQSICSCKYKPLLFLSCLLV